MKAVRFLGKLALYYAVVGGVFAALLWLLPEWRAYLPVGRVPALMNGAAKALEEGKASFAVAHAGSLGGSIAWMASAIAGAVLVSIPVSWVYMEVRNPQDYDQSLAGTIVVLPLVVTSVVVVVQNSLALSFSLAGIAGAVRFRNSLKSSGDLLFILLAIGIGLSCGIGAMELAVVTSVAFNLAFMGLWVTEYGERKGMKRFMSDFDPAHGVVVEEVIVAAVTTTTAAEKPAKRKREDDDDD